MIKHELSFDETIKRMDSDKLFSLLYPICRVSGVDTDDAIKLIWRIARDTQSDPWVVALSYRRHLADMLH